MRAVVVSTPTTASAKNCWRRARPICAASWKRLWKLAAGKVEILSLQWSQIEGIVLDEQNHVTWAARAEIALPWAKTETRREKRIPISSRLRAILEMRRFDPAGQPFKAGDYVFGNEVGQKVSDVGRAFDSKCDKAAIDEAYREITGSLASAL